MTELKTASDFADLDLYILDEHNDKFMHGSCHVLALALHQEYGLPLMAFWDPYNEDDTLPGYCGALVHFFVHVDEKLGLDIGGVRSIQGIAADFGGSLEDFELTGTNIEEIQHISPVDDEAIAEALAIFKSAMPQISPVR